MKTSRQIRAEVERRLAAEESQDHAFEVELAGALADAAALKVRNAIGVYETDAEVQAKISNPHPWPQTMEDA